jgi:hypothetical protein
VVSLTSGFPNKFKIYRTVTFRSFLKFIFSCFHIFKVIFTVRMHRRWSGGIVLATGPKVRGFKPGRGRWIFKGDKNP